MDRIQMVDLGNQYLRIKAEIDDAIQRVLTSTDFIQGAAVKEFTQRLSAYLGGAVVVTCGNGTDALQIAMMALDLKPGDEVIIPSHTYVAPLEVIALLGLTPVFVDVEEGTFNLDVDQLTEKISARTRAIVAVHLYGQCANMERILSVAAQRNLMVIEDAAQSLGTDYIFESGARQKAGTLGTVGITSFFPTKSLGCFGDGGALITRDRALGENIRMIANHGQKVKYTYERIGVNSRLDTLQAAILEVKLRHLESYIRNRNEAADFYDQAFAGLENVVVPARAEYSSHVFHQYTLKAERRDELVAHLKDEGIPSMIYYPTPLHLQSAYLHYGGGPGAMPVAEKLSKSVISLPMHTEMSRTQLERISEAILKFY